MAETPEKITITGCGLIGESWSALFAACGHDAAVWDHASPALAPLLQRISELEDAITRVIDARGEVGHACG